MVKIKVRKCMIMDPGKMVKLMKWLMIIFMVFFKNQPQKSIWLQSYRNSGRDKGQPLLLIVDQKDKQNTRPFGLFKPL